MNFGEGTPNLYKPYRLPSSYGTSGAALTTDGTGGLSWTSSASGYSGYSGGSGYSGYSGRSGYSGYSGFSGYSGPTGASGYSGYSGISGLNGANGIGTSGFSGYSGAAGGTGTKGTDGASGFSGYSGPTGASGFSGYSGASGYSGYSGKSGYSGYSAATGTSGFSGYSGPAWAEASPSQITSNQNDYSFTAGTSLLRLSCDADGRKITGFAGGAAGKVLYVRNVGTKELLFTHQDTASSAANRLMLPYPVSFVLRPDDVYEFVYDNTTQRWVMAGGYDGFLKDPRYCTYLAEEFAGGSSVTTGTMGELGLQLTGAGAISRTSADSSRWGSVYVSCAAGQDKSLSTQSPSGSFTVSAADQIIFWAGVKLPSNIADATNDYYVNIGVNSYGGTSLTTLATLGASAYFVGFEYDRTQSANWLYSASSFSNYLATSTGVTASANTWTDFMCVYLAGTPSATYYVNGTSVGTESTANAFPPSDGTANVSLFQFYYYRSAGAATRWFHMDYARVLIIRTTKRV